MLVDVISHVFRWFTPHKNNNFRAKILHNSGLVVLIGIVLGVNLFVRLLDNTSLHILGFTSSVTIDEVVSLTNEKRVSAGLQPLSYNSTLADAARRKAANMLAENYWAHNSPSGISPWHWFQQADYKYTHAGENLAKDFASTDRMVEAWMNSPTHRENIVSDKFDEIGIAVVPGNLLGEDTVLVVQLFGSTGGGAIPEVAEVKEVKEKGEGGAVETEPVIAQAKPLESSTPAPTVLPEGDYSLIKYNEFDVKRIASLVTTALMILVLIGDLAFAESRRLSRRVGKNWAHIIFINVILILTTIVNAGSII